MKKIIIGSDHAGYAMKEEIKKALESDYEIIDVGTNSEESVDYPKYAEKVAQQVALTPDLKGILVCGSATGMAITANKIPGVRAAVGYSKRAAELSRQHNNANVLATAGREEILDHPVDIVKTFLDTDFSGEERHQRRVNQMMEIERKNA